MYVREGVVVYNLYGDFLFTIQCFLLRQGKVVGFYDSWPSKRRFAVDMAGFAVNIKLLHQFPNATMIYEAGYEEDSFLKGLGTEANLIEAKAANCTQVSLKGGVT